MYFFWWFLDFCFVALCGSSLSIAFAVKHRVVYEILARRLPLYVSAIL